MKSHDLIHKIHKAMDYVIDMAKGKGGKKSELTPIQRQVFLQFLRQAGAQEESGKQLAAKCGVSQPTITNALRGKGSPSMATVRAIAAYLGVSETDIIGGAEPPPDGLVAPPLVLGTPKLLKTVCFAFYTLDMTVDDINAVLSRLVRAKVLITVDLLVDAFMTEKRVLSAGSLPGRPLK